MNVLCLPAILAILAIFLQESKAALKQGDCEGILLYNVLSFKVLKVLTLSVVMVVTRVWGLLLNSSMAQLCVA